MANSDDLANILGVGSTATATATKPKGNKPAPPSTTRNGGTGVTQADVTPFGNAPAAKPVYDFLGKASNVLETPFTLAGAGLQDALSGRLRGMIQEALHNGGDLPADYRSSLNHALTLLSKGQFGQAAQLYSLTSTQANKARAAAGDKGAQYFVKHPTQFGGLALGEEFANPSNLVTGEATDAFTGLINKAARAAGHVPPTGNRFEDVRTAAQEAPAQRAAAEKAAEAAKVAREAAAVRKAAAEARAARQRMRVDQARQASAADRGITTAPAPGNPALPPHYSMPPRPPTGPTVPTVVYPKGANLPTKPAPLAIESKPTSIVPVEQRPSLTRVTQQPKLVALNPGIENASDEEALRNALFGQSDASLPREPTVNPNTARTPKTMTGTPPAPPPIGGRPAIEGGEPQEALPPAGEDADFAAHGTWQQRGRRIPNPNPNEAEGPSVSTGTPERPQGAVEGDILGEPTPMHGRADIEGYNEPQEPQNPWLNASSKDVADEAEITLRKMADTKSSRAFGQKLTLKLFKGLKKSQWMPMAHAIEDSFFDNDLPANFPDRIGPYIEANHKLGRDLVDLEVAKPEELMANDRFISHAGAYDDPDEPDIDKGGTAGVRRGTINTDRTYRTLAEAQAAGAPINPDWNMPETVENTLSSRHRTIELERGVRHLKELGLIVAADKPKPAGWVTLNDEPDIAAFGSPTLRSGAAFHPAVAKAIRDIVYRPVNPERLLPSPVHNLMRGLAFGNYLASRFEVANPVFHPTVNVIPNQLGSLLSRTNAFKSIPSYLKEAVTVEGAKNLKQWAHGMATGGGVESAVKGGAVERFASEIPAHKMVRPWSDLSAKEKLERTWNSAHRASENVSNRPLYQVMEPRLGRAFYKAAQKGGMTDPEAAIATRQTLGEPENMSASEKLSAQAFQFPGWRKSVARLWPYMLGKNPALYNGPHRAIAAFNESRGVGPQPNDSSKLIPDIALGSKDAQGTPQLLGLPSPANIPLQAMEIAGSPLAGDTSEDPSRAVRLALTLANPLLNTGVRSAMTQVAKPGFPDTGLGGFKTRDLDAPDKGALGNAVGLAKNVLGRYAPVRDIGKLNPGSAVGATITPVANAGSRQQISMVESRFRKMIEKIRYAADDYKKQGQTAEADYYTKQADLLYNEMLQYLKAMGDQAVPQ